MISIATAPATVSAGTMAEASRQTLEAEVHTPGSSISAKRDTGKAEQEMVRMSDVEEQEPEHNWAVYR